MRFTKPQSEQRKPQQETLAKDGVSYSSLASLLAQNSQARLLKRGSHNVHAGQSGQHLSVYKGRGMDFTESRAYQAGDDVRLLDWRVTARTGKPHTKIFSEERERPVLLLVDLRSSMFFGTRSRFKSVLAAELASLLMWKSLYDGDKVGGVIMQSSKALQVYQPSRSNDAASRFMNGLALATQASRLAGDEFSLADTLSDIQPIIESGTQLIILSDFRGLDDDTRKLLVNLSAKLSLVLLAISDPFEINVVNLAAGLQISNGKRKTTLTQSGQKKYRQLQAARQQQLNTLARQANTSLIEVSTADLSASLMLKLSRGLR